MTQPDPFAPPAPPADEPQTAVAQGPASSDDPWAAPPQGFPAPPAPAQAPAAKPASAEDGKVVLTFKGGTGFDAPWIVIHATSLEDAHRQVTDENAILLAKVMAETQKAGKHFSLLGGGAPAAAGGNASRGGSNVPQAAQQAPNGQQEFCSHGEMIYKSDISKKTGKPYKMFACPERDQSQQCKAKFLN